MASERDVRMNDNARNSGISMPLVRVFGMVGFIGGGLITSSVFAYLRPDVHWRLDSMPADLTPGMWLAFLLCIVGSIAGGVFGWSLAIKIKITNPRTELAINALWQGSANYSIFWFFSGSAISQIALGQGMKTHLQLVGMRAILEALLLVPLIEGVTASAIALAVTRNFERMRPGVILLGLNVLLNTVAASLAARLLHLPFGPLWLIAGIMGGLAVPTFTSAMVVRDLRPLSSGMPRVGEDLSERSRPNRTLEGTDSRVFRSARHNYTVVLPAVVLPVMAILISLQSLNTDRSTFVRVVSGLAGAWGLLLGLSFLRSTYMVLTARVIVNGIGIFQSNGRRVHGIKWANVRHVQVRQRPDRTMHGHEDRVVVLSEDSSPPIYSVVQILRENVHRFVVNTSVYAPDEERELLGFIRTHVVCEIEEIHDGQS